MSFRVGGSSVEGVGPTALCSLGHRQHGKFHLLPQVDLWDHSPTCSVSDDGWTCTFRLNSCICCCLFKVAAAGFPEGV